MHHMPDPTLHPMHRLNVTDHKDKEKNIDIKIVSFIENKILDEANIEEIGQGLTFLAESRDRPKLLLDFQNVDHLSSAALGMLIKVNQKVKARSGELRLTGIKREIYEVFVITKLNNLFKIMPDRKAALDSFSPS
jgi:anti-sigma B factor antagonist